VPLPARDPLCTPRDAPPWETASSADTSPSPPLLPPHACGALPAAFHAAATATLPEDASEVSPLALPLLPSPYLASSRVPGVSTGGAALEARGQSSSPQMGSLSTEASPDGSSGTSPSPTLRSRSRFCRRGAFPLAAGKAGEWGRNGAIRNGDSTGPAGHQLTTINLPPIVPPLHFAVATIESLARDPCSLASAIAATSPGSPSLRQTTASSLPVSPPRASVVPAALMASPHLPQGYSLRPPGRAPALPPGVASPGASTGPCASSDNTTTSEEGSTTSLGAVIPVITRPRGRVVELDTSLAEAGEEGAVRNNTTPPMQSAVEAPQHDSIGQQSVDHAPLAAAPTDGTPVPPSAGAVPSENPVDVPVGTRALSSAAMLSRHIADSSTTQHAPQAATAFAATAATATAVAEAVATSAQPLRPLLPPREKAVPMLFSSASPPGPRAADAIPKADAGAAVTVTEPTADTTAEISGGALPSLSLSPSYGSPPLPPILPAQQPQQQDSEVVFSASPLRTTHSGSIVGTLARGSTGLPSPARAVATEPSRSPEHLGDDSTGPSAPSTTGVPSVTPAAAQPPVLRGGSPYGAALRALVATSLAVTPLTASAALGGPRVLDDRPSPSLPAMPASSPADSAGRQVVACCMSPPPCNIEMVHSDDASRMLELSSSVGADLPDVAMRGLISPPGPPLLSQPSLSFAMPNRGTIGHIATEPEAATVAPSPASRLAVAAVVTDANAVASPFEPAALGGCCLGDMAETGGDSCGTDTDGPLAVSTPWIWRAVPHAGPIGVVDARRGANDPSCGWLLSEGITADNLTSRLPGPTTPNFVTVSAAHASDISGSDTPGIDADASGMPSGLPLPRDGATGETDPRVDTDNTALETATTVHDSGLVQGAAPQQRDSGNLGGSANSAVAPLDSACAGSATSATGMLTHSSQRPTCSSFHSSPPSLMPVPTQSIATSEGCRGCILTAESYHATPMMQASLPRSIAETRFLADTSNAPQTMPQAPQPSGCATSAAATPAASSDVSIGASASAATIVRPSSLPSSRRPAIALSITIPPLVLPVPVPALTPASTAPPAPATPGNTYSTGLPRADRAGPESGAHTHDGPPPRLHTPPVTYNLSGAIPREPHFVGPPHCRHCTQRRSASALAIVRSILASDPILAAADLPPFSPTPATAASGSSLALAQCGSAVDLVMSPANSEMFAVTPPPMSPPPNGAAEREGSASSAPPGHHSMHADSNQRPGDYQAGPNPVASLDTNVSPTLSICSTGDARLPRHHSDRTPQYVDPPLVTAVASLAAPLRSPASAARVFSLSASIHALSSLGQLPNSAHEHRQHSRPAPSPPHSPPQPSPGALVVGPGVAPAVAAVLAILASHPFLGQAPPPSPIVLPPPPPSATAPTAHVVSRHEHGSGGSETGEITEAHLSMRQRAAHESAPRTRSDPVAATWRDPCRTATATHLATEAHSRRSLASDRGSAISPDAVAAAVAVEAQRKAVALVRNRGASAVLSTTPPPLESPSSQTPPSDESTSPPQQQHHQPQQNKARRPHKLVPQPASAFLPVDAGSLRTAPPAAAHRHVAASPSITCSLARPIAAAIAELPDSSSEPTGDGEGNVTGGGDFCCESRPGESNCAATPPLPSSPLAISVPPPRAGGVGRSASAVPARGRGLDVVAAEDWLGGADGAPELAEGRPRYRHRRSNSLGVAAREMDEICRQLEGLRLRGRETLERGGGNGG